MAKFSLKLTKRYLRDLKLARKRGMEESLLNEIIGKLLNDEPLPAKNHDHQLHGDYVLFKAIIAILFALVAMAGQAQTETPKREKQNWAVGGVLMLLAPYPDYYDKNLERYNPPVPMVWFGPAWLNDNQHGNFHFRSGVFNKIDGGCTILQISRNLYRGAIGVSASLQFGGSTYTTSRNYSFEKDGHRVEFVPADDEHKKEDLFFTMLRIPLMIGAQTNNRLFSLQTGVGLYQTTRTGAQWLVTAGLGPFTLNYSHHLTPLFKLSDGTKAYPSSFTIGVDVWYWLCRFTHP